MSVVPARLDMVTFAQRLLPAQFRGKTKWNKILKVLAAPFQELENAFQDLLLMRAISTAVGKQIDILGEIVDEKRLGADDESYLIRVSGRVLLIKSSGTTPQILALLSRLVAGTYTYQPYFPAAFTIERSGITTDAQAAELARALRIAKAAGVGAQFVFAATDESAEFLFSDDTEITTSTQGLADAAETDPGGALGDVSE